MNIKGQKSGLKLLAVTLTVVLSSVIYRNVYYIPELKDQGYMLYSLFSHQDKNDMLYFGESSNYWTADEDKDKRSISSMTDSLLTGFSLAGMQVPAYHAGIYLPVIKQISSSGIKAIIVTMNLRSFDQAWIYDAQAGTLNRSKCFYNSYNPLFNRISASLQYYKNPDPDVQDKKMLHAFANDSIKVNFPLKFKTIKSWCDQEKFPLPEGGEDFPKRVLADHYIKAYAFSIDTLTNQRIHDFDEIVKVCKQKDIRLYFNLLAENIEQADSLVGNELLGIMRSNRDLLVQRYTRMGANVIDNLETVPSVCFGEKNWTTEHYNQQGRMIIARRLANVISK